MRCCKKNGSQQSTKTYFLKKDIIKPEIMGSSAGSEYIWYNVDPRSRPKCEIFATAASTQIPKTIKDTVYKKLTIFSCTIEFNDNDDSTIVERIPIPKSA